MATYYERYVLLSAPEHHTGTHGKYTTWACTLLGEEIGKIEHCTDRYKTEKPYEAMVRITSKDWIRHRHVGWFDTLIEAKAALLEPGYEYLQESDKELQKSSIPLRLLPAVDSEFYPTPAALAGQLLSGVDWDQVDSVLEPNAGMGNLIDYAQRCIYGYYRKSNYGKRELDDVDCVELDPNLRAILISKGYRVVHDDFLDYHTRKRYSLILMNPPFSNGEMYLLHAIGICASGGQIACILNAETIRNPFSNSRKALLKELKRYGATIRYVNNAFAHAPRRAQVDVALINLHIPCSNVDTSIWDELQQAKDATLPDQESQTQLAPGNQIERLLREYDLLCKAGISLMAKYNGVAPHIHNSRKSSYSSPLIKLQIVGHSCDDVCSPDDVNRFLRAVRSRYWMELFDLPDLRDRMTSTMKDEYHSTIGRMENYEFSPFNIQQVLDQIRGQLRQGVEDAIIKCFDMSCARAVCQAQASWVYDASQWIPSDVWRCEAARYARRDLRRRSGRYPLGELGCRPAGVRLCCRTELCGFCIHGRIILYILPVLIIGGKLHTPSVNDSNEAGRSITAGLSDAGHRRSPFIVEKNRAQHNVCTRHRKIRSLPSGRGSCRPPVPCHWRWCSGSQENASDPCHGCTFSQT